MVIVVKGNVILITLDPPLTQGYELLQSAQDQNSSITNKLPKRVGQENRITKYTFKII